MDMKTLWTIVLIGSIITLLLVVVRSRKGLQILGNVALRIGGAIVLLYLLNAVAQSIQLQLHVPINGVTISIVSILGIPGVAALASIQWWVL